MQLFLQSERGIERTRYQIVCREYRKAWLAGPAFEYLLHSRTYRKHRAGTSLGDPKRFNRL